MAQMVCPWWLGYFLSSPIRRLWHNPEGILKDYVKKGDVCLEIGPGMGFFTLTLAEFVGSSGKVIAVDIQEKMLSVLRRKAEKAGLGTIIETRMCSLDSLNIEDLTDNVDFILLFAVIHEIPDQESLFRQLNGALKKGGSVLIAEPDGHVSEEGFSASLLLAEKSGWKIIRKPKIRGSKSVLMKKTN